MSNTFKSYSSNLRDPISNAEEVSPNDGTDLIAPSRALYVGAPGDIRATLISGATVTFSAVPTGWHPLRVSRVWASGTSASGIVACN